MNTMTTALVNAGFPHMPLIKRTWMWIADHPGCTPADMTRALNSKNSLIGPAIQSMLDRRMVTRKSAKRMTAHGLRNTYEYTVAMREYELLPLQHQRDEAARPVAKQPEKAPVPVPVPAPQPQKIDATTLPVAEAYALWLDLSRFFGTSERSQS